MSDQTPAQDGEIELDESFDEHHAKVQQAQLRRIEIAALSVGRHYQLEVALRGFTGAERDIEHCQRIDETAANNEEQCASRSVSKRDEREAE